MKNRLVPILACLVLGLAAVGCGDDEDGAGDDVSAPKAVETTGGEKGGGSGGAKAQKSVAVEVIDIDYEPREVTVSKGGTIKWTHTGNLPHTVTKDDGPGDDFDSATMNEGDTFEQTFDTAGTIEYVCRIHPQQRGKITVE